MKELNGYRLLTEFTADNSGFLALSLSCDGFNTRNAVVTVSKLCILIFRHK